MAVETPMTRSGREALIVETFERQLKGFTQAFTLYRLWANVDRGTAEGVEVAEEHMA